MENKVKKRVLINDIAKQLNVSIATVSLVLNGKAKENRISTALAERVLKHVEEVGYKPNQLAKSLRTGKTHVIGLIVEDISNPFFATVAWLIEKQAFARGYRIIYCSTNDDAEKTKDLISMFHDRHVDGYIIAPPEGVEKDINFLLKENIPTVLFDRSLPNLTADYVVVDGKTGMYDATCHLLNQGFSDIAFVTTRSEQVQMQGRMVGYKQALAERGKDHKIKRVSFEKIDPNTTNEIRDFILANSTCDAIIFANNSLTIHGLEAIKQLKMRIPEDMAIISFDDNDFFRLYSPEITVIEQPVESIVQHSIDILFKKLDGSSSDKKTISTITLSTSLIIRESSLRKKA